MKKLFYIFLIIFNSCTQPDNVNSVEMVVSLDTNYTTIGSPVSYFVDINLPANKIIEFSDWLVNDPLEVRSNSLNGLRTDKAKSGEIMLVFWDTGKVVIPGFPITILNDDSSFSYNLISDSLIMNVVSISEKDPTFLQAKGEVMPIKDPVPVKIPLPWKNIILLLIMICILVALVLISKTRKKSIIKLEDKPIFIDNPDLVALKKLDSLAKFELSDNGAIKDFYVELSHILREYTENSLYIRTLEMTTEDIRINRKFFPYDDKKIESYIKILTNADMVKYAKYYNNKKKCHSDLEDSIIFVKNTVNLWKPSFIGLE